MIIFGDFEEFHERALNAYIAINRKWNRVHDALGQKITVAKGAYKPGTTDMATRDTQALTELASILRGEPMASGVAKGDPRFRTITGVQTTSFDVDGNLVGSLGTYEGEVGLNMLAPLVDLFGPENRIIGEANRWLGQDKVINPKNPFFAGSDTITARRMLGVADDHVFTMDDMRALSKLQAEKNPEKLLDHLAMVAHWTNQETVYASRFHPIDGSEDLIRRLQAGESLDVIKAEMGPVRTPNGELLEAGESMIDSLTPSEIKFFEFINGNANLRRDAANTV
jgi:hypothetical protein